MTPENMQRVINALNDAAEIIEDCAVWANPATKPRLYDRALRYRNLLIEVGDVIPNTDIGP